jgi:DNA-binding response OmpR family regulator
VSEHILVVDDDPGIRQVVTLALQEAAYRVQEAANGEDALAQIAADPPALVLLDLQMPVMSGWQLLAQLSDHGLQVPVVVMTAGQRARTEAARLGAAGYLAKPFDLATLATVVATTARPRSTDPGD